MDYEIKKEAAEIEALKHLFNDNDVDRRKYRETLKRKRLRKLLVEEQGLGSKDLEEGVDNSASGGVHTAQ